MLREHSGVITPDIAREVLEGIDTTQATKIDYAKHITPFTDFGNRVGWNSHVYRTYKQWLVEHSNVSASTQRKRLVVARVFLRELHYLGILTKDITVGTSSIPTHNKHLRVGLSQREQKKVASFLRSLGNSKEDARLKAILSLALLHGLRGIELVRLEVRHFDPAGILHVQQKGSRDTEPMVLNRKARIAINDHVATSGLKDGALFPSHSQRTTSKGRHMTTDGMRRIIQQCLIESGVSEKSAGEVTAEREGRVKYRKPRTAPRANRRVSAHGIRHGHISSLARAFKGDLLKVGKLSRHKSISSVRRYTTAVELEGLEKESEQVFEGLNF